MHKLKMHQVSLYILVQYQYQFTIYDQTFSINYLSFIISISR